MAEINFVLIATSFFLLGVIATLGYFLILIKQVSNSVEQVIDKVKNEFPEKGN